MASALRQRGKRTRRGEKLKAEIHHMDLNLTSRSERYIGGLCFATSVLGSVRERAHSPHFYASLQRRDNSMCGLQNGQAFDRKYSNNAHVKSLKNKTQKSELTPSKSEI